MATDFTFNFDSVRLLFCYMLIKRKGSYSPVFPIKNEVISEDLWNSVLNCIGMCVNHNPHMFYGKRMLNNNT